MSYKGKKHHPNSVKPFHDLFLWGSNTSTNKNQDTYNCTITFKIFLKRIYFHINNFAHLKRLFQELQ